MKFDDLENGDLVKVLTVEGQPLGLVVRVWSYPNALETFYDVSFFNAENRMHHFLKSQLKVLNASR
jgi:hypothetical protein